MRVRTEERRLVILETAAQVFMELGFEKTAMSEIAERAGCSKPTLYGYFPSKTDLFMSVVVQRLGGRVAPAFSGLASRADEPAATVLEQLGERFIEMIASPDAAAIKRLIMATMTERADAEHFWEMGSRQVLEVVEKYLTAATRAGRLGVKGPRHAAQQLLGLYEAEVHWAGPLGFGPAWTPAMIKRASRRAVDVFLAAYGPKTNIRSGRDKS